MFIFRRMQAVLLGAQGMSAEQAAAITFYKAGYIREVWMRYRTEGERIFRHRQGKSRGKSYLSLAEEQAFLQPFLTAAAQAGILIVTDVHNALQKRIGKTIVLQTTYNLLHRHNWRKIVPRPYHPKRDSEKRREWLEHFPPGAPDGTGGSTGKKT